ncbi:T9SS type A sorting domain-containing protein, partial [candidate division KSB1 bacterium]|nr:T9SS type A sorting domain-containing protein [candidate division KSB1 bacterium]
VSSRQFVVLKVYDVLGKEVAILVNEEKPAGSYRVEFIGDGLTSGIYFYQLRAGNFIETKKMVLIR